MNAQQAAETAIRERDGLAADALRWSKGLAEASFADESTIRALGHGVTEAPIVVWTPEMFELAIGGYESFAGLHWKSVPQPSVPMFWYLSDFDISLDSMFTNPIYGIPAGYICGNVVLVPVGFRNAPRPLVVYVCYPGPEYEGRGKLLLRILRVDSNTQDGCLTKNAAQIFAAYAFTQLKIAALEAVQLPRAIRRRMARESLSVPDVRIIQLRQRESLGSQQAGQREYHHKWIVKGHWRRLHEPRKEDGAEVTFVHAYVKGPQDAPLLQPRESVYVVAR